MLNVDVSKNCSAEEPEVTVADGRHDLWILLLSRLYTVADINQLWCSKFYISLLTQLYSMVLIVASKMTKNTCSHLFNNSFWDYLKSQFVQKSFRKCMYSNCLCITNINHVFMNRFSEKTYLNCVSRLFRFSWPFYVSSQCKSTYFREPRIL